MVNREDSWVEFPVQGGRENMRNFSPRIQIGGNTGGMFGRGNGGGGEHNFETKWEFNDTVTLYRDSHTFKIGGDYLFSQFQQINNYGPDGVWDFSDINAFRAGLPTAFFQTWGHGGVYLKVHYFSGFAQDQWQPRPGLTIDYGIRYQYDHHPNDIASYTLPEQIFNPMTLERTDQAGSPGMKGFNNDNNNIAPRLGVAWTPDGGKTLFHAAGGSFYGIQYLGEVANPMGWNGPPSSYRFTFSQVEAGQIWAGTVNPASPYYNPLGIRRLPYYYYDRTLVPQKIPPTNNVFDTDLKTPMSWQGNFGVDRQLTQRVAVSGSFLWSRGYNNIRNVNKNAQAGVLYRQGALLPSGRVTPFDVIYRQGAAPRCELQRGLDVRQLRHDEVQRGERIDFQPLDEPPAPRVGHLERFVGRLGGDQLPPGALESGLRVVRMVAIGHQLDPLRRLGGLQHPADLGHLRP